MLSIQLSFSSRSEGSGVVQASPAFSYTYMQIHTNRATIHGTAAEYRNMV